MKNRLIKLTEAFMNLLMDGKIKIDHIEYGHIENGPYIGECEEFWIRIDIIDFVGIQIEKYMRDPIYFNVAIFICPNTVYLNKFPTETANKFFEFFKKRGKRNKRMG